MSVHPFLRLKGDIHQRRKIIDSERGTVAPSAELILDGREKVVAKNGPFSLTFCQIVTLMLPHRSVVAGRLDC
jgi:hypothetical protein